MNIEEMTVNVSTLEDQIREAATSGAPIELVLELATKLTTAQTELAKVRAEANAGAISDAESTLMASVRAVVDGVGWKDLTGNEIDLLIYYRQPVIGRGQGRHLWAQD